MRAGCDRVVACHGVVGKGHVGRALDRDVVRRPSEREGDFCLRAAVERLSSQLEGEFDVSPGAIGGGSVVARSRECRLEMTLPFSARCRDQPVTGQARGEPERQGRLVSDRPIDRSAKVVALLVKPASPARFLAGEQMLLGLLRERQEMARVAFANTVRETFTSEHANGLEHHQPAAGAVDEVFVNQCLQVVERSARHGLGGFEFGAAGKRREGAERRPLSGCRAIHSSTRASRAACAVGPAPRAGRAQAPSTRRLTGSRAVRR